MKAAVMLASLPYAHVEAAAFLGVCLASGALAGLLVAVLRMLRRA